GQAAASFRMSEARASFFNVGRQQGESLNKAGIRSEKMTVLGGRAQTSSLAERAATPMRSPERFFTARQSEITQRRFTSPPERRSTPDATNKQIERALGRQIGDF